MNFQIKALSETEFQHLFEMTNSELAERQACRQVVTAKPGTPCRVSMAEAEVGETVILLNYAHQPENSPYKASHAIFVREHVEQAEIAINDVPEVIRSRLISVRLFDTNHMMVDAEVVAGNTVSSVISEAFDRPEIAYIHLHNAKPGCFRHLSTGLIETLEVRKRTLNLLHAGTEKSRTPDTTATHSPSG